MLCLPNPIDFGWLVVFYVPSTARSFRDGTPINCPLKGREARFLHRSYMESNPGPSHGNLIESGNNLTGYILMLSRPVHIIHTYSYVAMQSSIT